MKDSTVKPSGLLNIARSRHLLDAMGQRIRDCAGQQQSLHQKFRGESDIDEAKISKATHNASAQCRDQRQKMLKEWDDTEETLTALYERRSCTCRTELNRLSVLIRRKKEEEIENIHRKVDARTSAVIQQYDNRKNSPGKQMKKELLEINEAILPIIEHIEWGKALTVRRLDRLPDVGPPETPEEDMSEPAPDSVKQAIDTVAVITRKCKKTVEEMQTGMAAKIVDSFYYLPAAVAIFLLIWTITVFTMVEKRTILWAGCGVFAAGAFGFTAYLILLWPLKRMTRRLYPQAIRLVRAAEQCAETGRKISRRQAAESSKELLERREAHLAAAGRWREEQVTELDHKLVGLGKEKRAKFTEALQAADNEYTTRYNQNAETMRAKADALAASITERLSDASQQVSSQRLTKSQLRQQSLERVANRLNDGFQSGLERIRKTQQQVDQDFPSWEACTSGVRSDKGHLDFLPLGSLEIAGRLRAICNETSRQDGSNHEPIPDNRPNLRRTENDLINRVTLPETLPIVLHRREHCCLVIHADSASMESAIDLCHQVLWRLLCSAPPGAAKLSLLDPMGRGQNFTRFMALADHDSAIVSDRIWTTDAKIESHLAGLAHHVEDVLQSSLRDRFERIEDYNRVAGSLAEPYRAVAGIGLPNGLSREGYKHLQALITSGMRCGVFTILVCDDSKPWPPDMPIPSGEHVMNLQVGSQEGWRLQADGLEELTFVPADSPPANQRAALTEQIGLAAVGASHVKIPLDDIIKDVTEAAGNSDKGLQIAIGSQGANRSLALKLGEGVRQHVLIAGKTGSGKSTLLHAIVTSGAYHYRPDQLQFYLLDFKKGVEFKLYADAGLPHARVIGIESEREFGRSVLQRLDSELQQRGERFRAAGVQELEDFRAANEKPTGEKSAGETLSGDSMPRIVLVIDEFQELFVRDDRLAGDCAMLLDRLVRQGRSFGMHVILSSQSLAGAYSLPRATLGQMAVRIAMQCSESDAALILSDENTAARLINRPGEAIYNDAGGLVEGNEPFQVAWLSPHRQKELLAQIGERDQDAFASLGPPVIFEGNRPCRWNEELADFASQASPVGALNGLLGESVEIGHPVSLTLSRDSGRNALVVASPAHRASVIASVVSGFAKSHSKLKVIYFDGVRAEDGDSTAGWLQQSGVSIEKVKTRDCESQMIQLCDEIDQRDEDSTQHEPLLVVIDPLERFRDLKQDESFSFSLDADARLNAPSAFQKVLNEGPAVGVFVLVICGSGETLSRWLPRTNQHDLELRILGQLNSNDSSLLIDSPAASDLSDATMLVYDNADGKMSKFRMCAIPKPEDVSQWLEAE